MDDDFEELLDVQPPLTDEHALAGAPVPPPPADGPRHARRKEIPQSNVKHSNRLALFVVLIVVCALLAGAGYLSYGALQRWQQSKQSAQQSEQTGDYPGPGDGEVQFVVSSGQNPSEIAQNLVNEDIIKSVAAFTGYVAANNITLYPGSFTLKYHMSAADAAAILADQNNAGGFVQVRAGERLSDVIAEAVEVSPFSEDEFNTIIDSGGAGILPAEASGSFEGWLEPGTYDVNTADSAADLLKSMVDKRVEKLDSLDVPTGQERERILIIASIAEAEVNKSEYYGKVCRVILNRLDQDMTLGMDSTVAYGADVKPGELTNALLNDATNPYNTRIHKGLPPGPIGSPGDDAIKAALDPEQGNWLYFVTTNLDTGETKFTDSETEFWKLRDEYKNSGTGDS